MEKSTVEAPVKLDEWRNLAASERDQNLVDFNFSNLASGQLVGAFQKEAMEQALARFEEFLEPLDSCSAEQAIDRFYEDELSQLGASSSAYIGQPAGGTDRYRALKTLSFFNRRASVLGYDNLNIEDVRREVDKALGRFKVAYVDESSESLKDQAKTEVDVALSKALDAAKPNPAVAGYRAPHTPVIQDSTLSWVPRGFTEYPLWVTTAGALENEDPRDGASLGPLERSGYASGLKALLGLHSGYPTENAPERQFFDPEPGRGLSLDDFVRYRTILSLTIDLEPLAGKFPTQPTIFSGGYYNMFVCRGAVPSRATPGVNDMVGRTVRLRSTRCSNHGDTCPCGAPGLPEAVLPENQAMRAGLVTCTWHAALFSEDLIYVPPECEMVRTKNPVP